MGLSIARMSGSIGAEISGIDLSQTHSDATIAELRQALLDHLVIVFRDQTLTPQQQLDFSRRFGDPVAYPFVKGLDGFPEITPILKREEDRSNFGGIWHSDTTYQQIPPMGTILYALEVPPQGGDTEFANQYLAWETLSDGLRSLLDGLIGVSISGKARVQQTRTDMMKHASIGKKGDELVAHHPVARTHPETGRKALYVNVAHTERFEGWTEAESEGLLEYLFQHQIQSEFTCRLSWKPGTVAFWDNRSAQHNPINDYHGYRRLMHRVTLAGEKPV